MRKLSFGHLFHIPKDPPSIGPKLLSLEQGGASRSPAVHHENSVPELLLWGVDTERVVAISTYSFEQVLELPRGRPGWVVEAQLRPQELELALEPESFMLGHVREVLEVITAFGRPRAGFLQRLDYER